MIPSSRILQSAHTPGRHCAGTGIAGLVNFHGAGFSDAMCFGLGEGLSLRRGRSWP